MTAYPDRRGFLRTAALTAIGGLVAPRSHSSSSAAAPTAAPLARPLSPQDFKQHLAGPILSLPTTFNSDLSVNLNGVHQMVRRARRYDIPVFELTAGNSKYAQLSYDEIKQVTRAMVEAGEQSGLTIAATGAWPTDQVIDYARYAESLGADALQILLPDNLKHEDKLFAHFDRIAKETRLPIVLHGLYSESLLRRLVELDPIVAMKEDGPLDYYIDRAIEFGDRLEIFSGGAENRYLVGYPYGSRSFFATYSGFAPDIPMKFWAAIREGNLQEAVAINKRYDHPFIKKFSHSFWHATLEYFGVATRFMRAPFETYSDEQMREVREFFNGQGLNPADYA
jgi:dihydrodipicolinate synthase/N-acetylneuraminate lyase